MPLACPRCHAIVPSAAPGAAAVACPQCGTEIRLAAETLLPGPAAAPAPPAFAATVRPVSSHSQTVVDSTPRPAGPGAAAELTARIGPYRVVRELGRGGMGIVYEAEDETLGRRVALKVLPPAFGLGGSPAVDRFRREASAAARLDHPNIARVHRVDEHLGTHYYVMDFIEGVPLHTILRERALRPPAGDAEPTTQPAGTPLPLLRGPAAVREAVRLLAEVAGALAQAHAQGIIHRDLKPSNLIYQPKGRLVLTDFGLAKMEDSVALTASGEVIGTPAYMSPEQATGHAVDARTDVWSLGVTLYETVTGVVPFQSGDRQDLLRMILAAEPVDPGRLNPHCPPDLATVILKALEKDPARRYRTARELQQDLERWLAGEPVQARPLQPFQKTVRRILGLPIRYGYGSCSMLVLLASFFVVILYAAAAMACLRWFPSEGFLQGLFYAGLTLNVVLSYLGVALGVFAAKVRAEAPIMTLGGLVMNALIVVLANLLVLHHEAYGRSTMLLVEGYRSLAPASVRDWPRLAARIQAEGAQPGPSPGARIWSAAAPETRQAIATLAAATRTDRAQEALLLAGLNRLLERRDFADGDAWGEVTLGGEELQRLAGEKKAGHLRAADVPRFNLLLLEAGFPTEIQPSPEIPWGPYFTDLARMWGPHGGSRWFFALAAVALALGWLALVGRFDLRWGNALVAAALVMLLLKAADDRWLNYRAVWELEWDRPGGVARALGGFLALVMANALVAAAMAAGLTELRGVARKALVPTAALLVAGLAMRFLQG